MFSQLLSPVTTKHNFAKPCFSLFVFSSYYVVVFFVLLFFRLRVPCCLSFAYIALVVGADMGLASFELISIIVSESLLSLVIFSCANSASPRISPHHFLFIAYVRVLPCISH